MRTNKSLSFVLTVLLFCAACGGEKTSQATTNVAGTTEPLKVATTTSTPEVLCADGGVCHIGDIGPGGGTIFFIDEDGVLGTRFFEVACVGWANGCDGSEDPEMEWGCDDGTSDNQPKTIRGIGAGAENTKKVIKACPSTNSAAQVVSEFSTDSTKPGDWFLPSAEELDELCKYVVDTEPKGMMCSGGSELKLGFLPEDYWSSSVKDEGEYRRTQLGQDFKYGMKTTGACYKWDPLNDASWWQCPKARVRPVRSF
jgi:hypothetical protein